MRINRSLTIIIPCYNEGGRIAPLLAELSAILADEPNLRVLIIDDGSTPEHRNALERLIPQAGLQDGRLKVHSKATNGGKGSALAIGFELAETEIVGFIDADGSVNGAECLRLVEAMANTPDCDAVIGSRIKMLGRVVVRQLSRHLSGRIFATIVSNLFAIPVYDSQCGCKFFRRAAIMALLPKIISKTWLWDTELLILAYREGLKVIEVPVSWAEVPGSKVSMLVDPIRMLLQLLSFRASLEAPTTHSGQLNQSVGPLR